MKIYDSTDYIKHPQIGDLKLEVNSMWDFGSRDICFKDIDKTFGGGKTTIPYNLKRCVEVRDSFVVGSNPPEPCKSSRWENAEITPEILSTLTDKGYTVAKKYVLSTLNK